MNQLPNLHGLALFLSVIEHRTMRAAAEAANITQPAISAQVKALERFYGTILLERSGRRVRPTVAGQLVADYARRTLSLVNELGEAIADLEELRGGQLTVGASASVGDTILPEFLGRFRQAYPAIELKLRIGNSSAIINEVRQRVLPFGIVGRDEGDEDLEAWPVIEDYLEIFAAPGHPLVQRCALHVSDLTDETFVMREPGSATRELALKCFGGSGFTPTRTVQFGSNEAVKRAVSAGLGIGVLSMHTLVVDLRAGVLVTLPCVGWNCHRQFSLIRRRDRHHTQIDRAFFQILGLRASFY